MPIHMVLLRRTINRHSPDNTQIPRHWNSFTSSAFDPVSAVGYERWSRARARHGRSTSSTGSQSANVDSREGDFGFSPDFGRGPGAALTGSFDPTRTIGW